MKLSPFELKRGKSCTVKKEGMRLHFCRKLKDDGVQIIIALGHSGYLIDIELAENIPELDLVVGGHSHTFLYTDTGNGLPSNDQPKGDCKYSLIIEDNGQYQPSHP